MPNKEIIVFTSSIGEDSYKYCLESLKKQKNVDYELHEIKFMGPWDKVLNYMLKVATEKGYEYYAQLDEDIVLTEDAALRAVIDYAKADPKIAILEVRMRNIVGNDRCGGLKIFHRTLIDKYTYKEMNKTNRDFVRRVKAENPNYKFITYNSNDFFGGKYLGSHGDHSSPQLYFFQNRRRVQGFNPLERKDRHQHAVKALMIFFDNYLKHPCDQTMFGVIGGIVGLFTPGGFPPYDKLFHHYNSKELDFLTKIFELPPQLWQTHGKRSIAFLNPDKNIREVNKLINELKDYYIIHLIIYNPRNEENRNFNKIFKSTNIKYKHATSNHKELAKILYRNGIQAAKICKYKKGITVVEKVNIPVIRAPINDVMGVKTELNSIFNHDRKN